VRSVRTAAAALALCLAATPAFATVSCTVGATGPAFGLYNPLATGAAQTTGKVTVTCSLLSGGATTVTPSVDLSAGSSGSFATRTMLSGTQALNYNIYWSTAYTQVWGDGTGGSFPGTTTLALSPLQPTLSASGTMYAQAPALQSVGAGTYVDTVIVTIAY
jgi:spore coat protein U-like protein